MEGFQQTYPNVYQNCSVVRKIRQGSRRFIVSDKNGTIQRLPQPVANPCPDEIGAGKNIRRITAGHSFVACSAQTIDLNIPSDTLARSRARGLDRPPPKVLLPDGTRTHKIEDIPEWGHLHSFDAMVSLGSGIYLRQEDPDGDWYAYDEAYDMLLGGSEWRPQFFRDLWATFPDGRFEEHLGLIDRAGVFELGGIDTEAHRFRVEWEHPNKDGKSGKEERDELLLGIVHAQLKYGLFQNVEIIDESYPPFHMLKTYAVSTYAQKDLAVDRLFSSACHHAGVPTSEMEAIPIGDAPPDLRMGLSSFQGAGDVAFILAGDSPLAESLVHNHDTYAGVPLPGSPSHPTLPGEYFATQHEGVFVWKGKNELRPRKVVVASYAPWSKGLPCTQSVYACLDYMGFRE